MLHWPAVNIIWKIGGINEMKDSQSKYLMGPQELLHYPCLVYKSWNDVWILELKVYKWLMLLLFAYLKYFKGLRNDRM